MWGKVGNWPDDFYALYPVVEDALKNLSIRKDIAIFGPETSGAPWNGKHVVPSLRKHGVRLDYVGDHNYLNHFDYRPYFGAGGKLADAVKYYAQLNKDLESLYGHHVPIFIGEYGHQYGDEESETEGPLLASEMIVRYLGAGVTGFLQWNFGEQVDAHKTHLHAISRTKERKIAVNAPVYLPHALFARHFGPGWKVLPTTASGGKDSFGYPRLYGIALASPEQHVSVLLTNNGYKEKQLTIELPSPYASAQLSLLSVSSPFDKVTRQAPKKTDDRKLRIVVPPRSINVLTSRPDNNLQ